MNGGRSHVHKQVILVVEDDPRTRKLLRVTLEAKGYYVLEARDGRAAASIAARGMPGLILQDLVLPDAAGFELLRLLRTLPGGSQVPVVAISGMKPRLQEAFRARAGFDGMLLKPVEPTMLLRVVSQYLPSPVKAPEVVAGEPRVLLVDDNPQQRKLLRLSLKEWGFAGREASNVDEALAILRNESFDAVVCDVLMPDKDGFQMCSSIREEPALASLPVILLSASTPDDEDWSAAGRVGATLLLMGTPGFWGLREALVHALEAAARGAVAD